MSDIERVHRVYVGIGSNIEPIAHIKKCIKSDEILLEIYSKIEKIKGESKIFSDQKDKIEKSLLKNLDISNILSCVKKS